MAKKKSILPGLAIGLGALALGTQAIRSGLLNRTEQSKIQSYVDLADADRAKGGTIDPLEAGKHYYQQAADVQQTLHPFGVDAVTAMTALRSNPLTPDQWRMTPTSREHYVQTAKSPLHANVHILTESTDHIADKKSPENALDSSNYYRLRNVLNAVADHGLLGQRHDPVSAWAMPGRFKDSPADLAAFQKTVQGHVDRIRALPGDVPKPYDLRDFTNRIKAAESTFVASQGYKPSELKALPIAAQMKMLDAFDKHLAVSDPNLYKQKAIVDLSTGIDKSDWSEFYPKLVYKPAIATAKALDWASLGLGAGAAGILAYHLLSNKEKRKNREIPESELTTAQLA